MKRSIVLLLMIIATSSSLFAQEEEKKSGFSNIRLYYSFMSLNDGISRFNDECLFPLGTGAGVSYAFGRKISADLDIEIYSPKSEVHKGYLISWPVSWPESSYIDREYTNTYIIIPLHLSYRILKRNSFKMSISGGYRQIICRTHYTEKSPNEIESIYWDFQGSMVDVSMKEHIRIYRNLNLFLSQSYGFHLEGKETIRFGAGLSFRSIAFGY